MFNDSNDSNNNAVQVSRGKSLLDSQATLPDLPIQKAKELCTCSLKTSILQIPQESNSELAICQAELRTADNKTFTDIGCATPELIDSNNPADLLNAARQMAIMNTLNVASALIAPENTVNQHTQSRVDMQLAHATGVPLTGSSVNDHNLHSLHNFNNLDITDSKKSVFNTGQQHSFQATISPTADQQSFHSKTTLMTPKQSKMLNGMAANKKIPLEELAPRMLGKSISALSSFDANSLIQTLKNM